MKKKETHPMIQTMRPTRDNIKERKANGKLIKNPKGLQSAIIAFYLFISSVFAFLDMNQSPFRRTTSFIRLTRREIIRVTGADTQSEQ